MTRPLRIRPRTCPTPTKRAYPSQWFALAALAPTDWPQCRAYKCQCGRWHLTSSDPTRRPDTED